MTAMDRPPPLFDRKAILGHRARAASNPALFLQDTIADEIQERLTEVNKTFTKPAIVAPFPQIWKDRLPSAKIIQDDDTLALQQGVHDLIVHFMALHCANDPVGQLVQCQRALQPDGLLIATLFGGQTLTELRHCLTDAEVRMTGGLSPRVAPMGDVRDLGGLLQRAGLALPVADTIPLKVSYASALELMRDLRAMGETNAMTDRRKSFMQRDILLQAAQLYAERHSDAEGRITATFEIVTLTGWAPAPTQPQPLRPGSATSRLADVLGVAETPLNRADD